MRRVRVTGMFDRQMTSFARPDRRPHLIRATLVVAAAIVLAGCIDKDDAKKIIEALQSGLVPDSLPVMQNAELPFKYPPDLYAKKVQGNVTLRIHIDSSGHVRPESTTVVE